MDIIAYLAPLRKWWWLLLAATLLAGVTSFFAAAHQPKVYQSRTTLVIGRAINEPNPTSGEFYLAQQLASMYADMANREPVRKATMEILGVNWMPKYTARALPNTQLIEIAVTDTDPARAQVFAAELAHQLILQSPTNVQPGDQERQKFINDQLATLQQQIKDTQAEIEKLRLQMGTLNSARQIADMQTQITGLETKVTTLQTTYASLVATTNLDATNSLSIIEPAEVPSTPVSPNPFMIIVLASAIGLALASLGAYAIEYLDNTLKTPEDIIGVTGLPILGYISKAASNETGRPYVAMKPRSIVAETMRSLRSNLEIEGFPGQGKTLLVTSAGPYDGKSFIVTNLAAILAQGGKDVIIVDGDFRKPQIHNLLGIPNQIGINQIVNGRFPILEAMSPCGDKIKGVITTGMDPDSMLDKLDSKTVKTILGPVSRLADLVIVDSAPALIPDTVTWAKNVDGVIVVIRPEHTQKEVARAAIELLRRSGVRLVGVVINQIPGTNKGYGSYYGYQHYASHYYSGNGKNGRGEGSVNDVSREDEDQSKSAGGRSSHKNILG